MKKILIIGLMSFGLFACDNSKQATVESMDNQLLVKEFKDSYLKSCLSYRGTTVDYCECAYSEITKTYSELEMVNIYTKENQNDIAKLTSDLEAAAKKCLQHIKLN